VTARPTIIRWISDVPSKIVKILAVRAVYAGQRPVHPVVSARIQHALSEMHVDFGSARVRFRSWYGRTPEKARRPSRTGDPDLIAAPLESAEWEHYGQVIRDTGLRHYRVALEITGIQARALAAQAGLGVLAAYWPPCAGPATLPGLRPVEIGRGYRRPVEALPAVILPGRLRSGLPPRRTGS
jgi:hypothetical protein